MLIHKFVTIVIVSYKSKKKILGILKKISNKFKVIIVDNSNTNELKKEIAKKHKNTKVFIKKNIGYGRAANYARLKLNTKFFLLINPDIQNLRDSIIEKFYKIAIELKEQFLCIGPSYTREKIKEKITKVSKISGAVMFINSNAFDKLNGFDKNIFLYFEEDDLCARAKKKNLDIYKVNNIYAKHKMGTSVELSNVEKKKELKKLLLWHFIWSKYYFYRKNYGNFLSIILFVPTIIRIYFKIFINYLKNDQENYQKYLTRKSGIFASIKGQKSYKR